MTNWNYRLIAVPKKGYDTFEIHEVYYESDKPRSMTRDPLVINGSVKEIAWKLSKMWSAFNKPILWGDKRFPEEYSDTRPIESNITPEQILDEYITKQFPNNDAMDAKPYLDKEQIMEVVHNVLKKQE